MFKVYIREETFQREKMGFLVKRGFDSKTIYTVVDVVQQKLLIADEESGEMVELFPRNCIYIK